MCALWVARLRGLSARRMGDKGSEMTSKGNEELNRRGQEDR